MAFQIKIDGPIGGEINKQFITNELEKANGEDIDLKISSLGGSVDDAFAIHDSLKDYSGHVKAIYTGFVASAATIIGAGADEGEMSPNALFLVHKSLSGVMVFGHLNEEDIDKLINDLNDIKNTNKKVDLIIANIYAQSTGRKAKTMLNLMSENKWLNAEETRDFGFIDNISHPEKKKKKAEVLALVSHIEKENTHKLPGMQAEKHRIPGIREHSSPEPPPHPRPCHTNRSQPDSEHVGNRLQKKPAREGTGFSQRIFKRVAKLVMRPVVYGWGNTQIWDAE